MAQDPLGIQYNTFQHYNGKMVITINNLLFKKESLSVVETHLVSHLNSHMYKLFVELREKNTDTNLMKLENTFTKKINKFNMIIIEHILAGGTKI